MIVVVAQTTIGYVVGIDAGGTGVRAALADATNGIVLDERKTAADPDGGPEPVRTLIGEMVRATGLDPASVLAVRAGITKVSRSGVQDRWDAALGELLPSASVACVADYVIGFHGAVASGVGIAALAGTGSVVYGENGRDAGVRVGGRGWEFGDEGSGAWLTTEIVRRTLRALDGLEKPSRLTDALCDLLGTREPAALGEAARWNAVESGRGFLAPLALDRARAGDEEAKNLFVGAAGWLAVQVRATATRLNFAVDEPVTVAMVGGLWSAGDLIRQPFESIVHRYLPQTVVIEADAPPLQGAVRMALRTVVAGV